MTPIVKSIFHVAGVSVDIVLPEMKPEDFHAVADCKALGAWLLHKVCRCVGMHGVCIMRLGHGWTGANH